MTEPRILMLVNTGTGEIVEQVNVTGRDEAAVQQAAARLRAKAGEEDFHVEDSARPTGGEEFVDADPVEDVFVDPDELGEPELAPAAPIGRSRARGSRRGRGTG